jgi:RHS repeat-associated protein
MNNGTPTTQTLDFTYDAGGIPLTVTTGGAVYYYITNLQGDVMAITNSSGTAVVKYRYDPYGKLISTTGSKASTLGKVNPLTYRSYVYDTETGLYYLQSRYYDPGVGRFINADVFTSTGQGVLGNNMFAYCGNNPANRSDPTGQLWGIIAVGTLASVVTSAVSSWIAGEEFTIGDAVGAAIEGFMATSLTILGVSPIFANPVSTFCGTVIGKFIDGDTSSKATDEILYATTASAVITGAFSGAHWALSRYADNLATHKFLRQNTLDKLIRKMTYVPLNKDGSSIKTILSETFWDSAKGLSSNIISHEIYMEACR